MQSDRPVQTNSAKTVTSLSVRNVALAATVCLMLAPSAAMSGTPAPEGEAVSTGELITSAVRDHAGRLDACAGEIGKTSARIRFVVDDTGHARDVQVIGANDAAVERCISQRVSEWRMPSGVEAEVDQRIDLDETGRLRLGPSAVSVPSDV